MSQSGYDEVGTRTRQAWLRTGLGVIAVTLLAMRGLVLAGAPTAVVGAAVVPGIVATAVVAARMRRLGPGLSPAIGRTAGLVLLAAILGIAASGIVAAVFASPTAAAGVPEAQSRP